MVAKRYLIHMGQPVKLSDQLVLDARIVGEAAERSIASQIEFWARLGRAIEPVLRTDEALRLKQRGEAVPLSACLGDVDAVAGRDRVKAFLASSPYPRFEPAADRPGLIVKIDEDGTRTIGRFVNRKFRPARRR
jgi:ParD-like antitoxin of type II bacterial toxin-antitoxin system